MLFETIVEWNPWWENKEFKELIGIKRENTHKILDQMPANLIQTLAGIRRSGKSTILYQIVEELIKKGVPSKEILFINMEDEVLLEADFDRIKDVYIERMKPKGKSYLFVDETQNREKWQYWIKKQYDLKKFKQIFISGSSSSLISSTYSSLLTGRQSNFIVFPLNFKEFLRFKGQEFLLDILSREKKVRIKTLLNEYIQYGGFPYVVLKEEKHQILVNYFNTIKDKDIILNYGLNEQKVGSLLRFLLSNISKLHTNKKLASIIKVSTTTVGSYLNIFEKSFLLFEVPIFSYKIKEQLQYPRKIYCSDTGLRNVAGFNFSKDLGRLYENIVAVELKRRKKEFYYWKDFQQREVDFVIKQDLKVKELIQVCFNIQDYDVKKRELNALIKASNELRCKNLLVITEDKEGETKIKGKKIKYISLWKWLLFS